MKKKIVSASAIVLAVAFLSSSAYSWNFATHAYIADKIGKVLPLGNFNEMYGCMLPDFLNTEFSLWGNTTVRGYTHGVPPTDQNYMLVWDNANWGLKKSLAYGYVAHNDVWGADFIAHWQSNNPYLPNTDIPFPSYKPSGYTLEPPGYIIYLAAVLDFKIAQIEVAPGVSLWDSMGLGTDYPTRLEFCHNLIEYAGDLIIKRADPMIGRKLILAAVLRTPECANLFKAAFPEPYGSMFAAAEPQFRQFVIQYGLILLQPEATAISIMADQLADLAIDYLEFMTGAEPGSLDGLKPGLVEFGNAALAGAVEVCTALGYMDQINLITIPYVKGQLAAHGVLYW